MQLKTGFAVLLVPTIACWCQFAGGRIYAHIISREPGAPIDMNIMFIHEMTGFFLTKLLDPCELLQHTGPSHSLLTKDGRITVRYRVTGPPTISSSCSDHCDRKGLVLASEQSVELPLVKSCLGLPIFKHFQTSDKDGGNNKEEDIFNHDIFRYLNYTLTHLHIVLENLATWKPILDNERTGDITMAFELDTNQTTADRAPLPIWMGFNRERTITLPLRDEDIKLPDLGNLDFYWQQHEEKKSEGDFPDMDSRFGQVLEYTTCIESARRDILVGLMADGQLTLDRHVEVCKGRPWSTGMAVFPKGWPLTDLPPTSTPVPPADEEDKYKGCRWANQGYDDGRDDSVDPRYWDRFTKWLSDELEPQPQSQPGHSNL